MFRLSVLLCGLLLTVGIGRADWQELQALDRNAPILVISGFVTDAGKFISSTHDSVLVDTRAGQVKVAKDDIDEIFVFRSRTERVRSGLVWGGVAAGATAAAMFPTFARFSNPNFAAPAMFTVSNGASLGVLRYQTAKMKRIYRRTK